MWSKQKSPRFAVEKTANPVGGPKVTRKILPPYGTMVPKTPTLETVEVSPWGLGFFP